MSRSERKKEAAERKKAMKLQWLELIQKGMASGRTYRQALEDTARSASDEIGQCPQRKAEILVAWAEMATELRVAAKTA